MAENDLFDLIIPPGVPRKMILELLEDFDVELVERRLPVTIGAMDGDVRDLLAFRGERGVLEELEEELLRRLHEFVGDD
ncbi:MAG: hypothetical protein ACXQTG_02835 [Methanoculleaceae archaeon]